ncbi:polysaccharide deacetylase family protein [Salipaludibacillus sp. HK11]|uniref:polysaccharide deacetylase family protein n=1 Tax=Salipaludibacillus sp. HK11 TaxID=3394320 RepID=UPI0039FC7B77
MKIFRVIILFVLLTATATSYVYLQSFTGENERPLNQSILIKNKTDFNVAFVFNKTTSEEINIGEVNKKWQNKSIHSTEWGENVTGVKNKIDTNEKVIALTFDACGGEYGNDYDEELIAFLNKNEIPATLFFNARWIRENEEIFLELADNPLFSVQNHGTNHLPLSVSGNTAWGIEGTDTVEGVMEEVMENQRMIEDLTGESPQFFRSGTAYYDDVAVEIVSDLGLTVVNYDILGDAGATYSASQVEKALLESSSGSIPLLHMNQPSSGTAEGVINAIPILKKQGYSFVQLDDHILKE